jgi:tubulin polyglutamylase TTLL4
VHLTNYSVNKKAEHYVKNENANVGGATAENAEEPVESKLNFSQLRQEFIKMGCDYEQTFADIQDLLVKAVLSVESPVVTAMGGGKHKSACFEIYGFDVLIDAKMRPWLLEVNVSPSLSSSSPLDK